MDAAIDRFGGHRFDWIDLSTGINPHPYPVTGFPQDAWSALPDSAALTRLITAARAFWSIPPEAAVIAAPGASTLIAQIPGLVPPQTASIPGPTYNEHAAAFRAHGWAVTDSGAATAQVVVHPNNPDGKVWRPASLPQPAAALTVIDESFCDTAPLTTMIDQAIMPGTLVLKSFGKFWGLAGLRLGFAVGDPAMIAHLAERIGPWAVSGPALHIGAVALSDTAWAIETRNRLAEDAARLDALMHLAHARAIGGTSLFRLYDVEDATAWQTRLAKHHIWSRVFPYNPRWLRLGLPHNDHWSRVEEALA